MKTATSNQPADPGAAQGVDEALSLLRLLGQELIDHSRRTSLSLADRGVLHDLARQLLHCTSEAQDPPAWAREMCQELMACARPPRPIKMGALHISMAE